MTKKDYKITEKAGPFVAGRPSPGAGETISLTADQAFYPLQLGEITASDDTAQATGDHSETPAEALSQRQTSRPGPGRKRPDHANGNLMREQDRC